MSHTLDLSSSRATAPADTRLDAYWFWGPIPNEETMREQLSAFRAQGFTRIYIQARFALALEDYLSPQWLCAYRTAVDIMADLGLRAGLYDDYAFTSGQAGGRTVEGADHLREIHLFWSRSTGQDVTIANVRATLGAALGPAVRNWIHEGGIPVPGDWHLVAATLFKDGQPPLDITADVVLAEADQTQASFKLKRPLPEGASWTVFASARITTSRIINYLLPEAGARFVDKGLKPYAEALGTHMGTTVDCLFYDQPAPALYEWDGQYGNLINSLPWSDALAASIAGDGPLALQLAALLEDCGEETDAIRSRIYRKLTGQMQEAFFGPLRRFCQRHDIALTGHEILPHISSFDLNGGFSSIDPRVALAADFFGTDLWRDETSVDANNVAAQLAPLLGDSIARASGRKGCWAELYLTSERSPLRASGQWELTPHALRRQLLRLHLLGASRIILHALYASAGEENHELMTNMRFDFPPGYNLQPWWPVFADLSKETAALADFMEAPPPPQVALFYPYETALRRGPWDDHAEAFGAWCEALLEHGHHPLICDEAGLSSLLEHGRLHGSEIAAIALPGTVDFHDTSLLNRLQASDLPVYVSVPDDLPGLFGPNVPQMPPTEGVRSVLAGRDAEGIWSVVVFNETDEVKQAEVISNGGVRSCEPLTEAAAKLVVELAPQELRMLRLEPAEAQTDCCTLASALPVLGDCHEVLQSDWTLEAGSLGKKISVDRGWQAQGLADWSGTGDYTRDFSLEQATDLILELPGVACAAEVFLDGLSVGRRHHAPYRFELGTVSAGRHELRISVSNTMANAFCAGTPYAGDVWPDVSGLTAAPVLHEGVTPGKEPLPSLQD
ncbi:carbohydrate-binding protein [Rhodobacterales bacterium]|nr:carbohydrate-binding protein [Rhodobacterales bacterium]